MNNPFSSPPPGMDYPGGAGLNSPGSNTSTQPAAGALEFRSLLEGQAFSAEPPAMSCVNCGCSREDTPTMRHGPLGPATLCNACGLLWRKHGKLRDIRTLKNCGRGAGKRRKQIEQQPSMFQGGIGAAPPPPDPGAPGELAAPGSQLSPSMQAFGLEAELLAAGTRNGPGAKRQRGSLASPGTLPPLPGAAFGGYLPHALQASFPGGPGMQSFQLSDLAGLAGLPAGLPPGATVIIVPQDHLSALQLQAQLQMSEQQQQQQQQYGQQQYGQQFNLQQMLEQAAGWGGPLAQPEPTPQPMPQPQPGQEQAQPGQQPGDGIDMSEVLRMLSQAHGHLPLAALPGLPLVQQTSSRQRGAAPAGYVPIQAPSGLEAPLGDGDDGQRPPQTANDIASQLLQAGGERPASLGAAPPLKDSFQRYLDELLMP